MSGSNLVPVGTRPGLGSNLSEERGRSTSRWSTLGHKINIPGLPTNLPTCLTPDQIEGFVLAIRLEEVNRKLQNGDVLPQHDRRSPSPDPVYGPGGVRVNTREARYKTKLEEERQHLIDIGNERVPGFRPPADAKKSNSKLTDKIYIPIQDFPHVNFMGMLIGPRGKSLKQIENDSGAKISIRGKGSVKEGRGASVPGADEDLHCLITADTDEQLQKAIEIVNQIIETATSLPDGQNEMKKMQLRELAALNGTLREETQIVCLNCGEVGHKRFECTAGRNYTNTIVCKICGGAGHIAADCNKKNDPEALAEARKRNELMDNEYASLMAELGHDVPNAASNTGAYGPRKSFGGRDGSWKDRRNANDDARTYDRNQQDYHQKNNEGRQQQDKPQEESGPAPWLKKDQGPAPWAEKKENTSTPWTSNNNNNNNNYHHRSGSSRGRFRRNHHGSSRPYPPRNFGPQPTPSGPPLPPAPAVPPQQPSVALQDNGAYANWSSQTAYDAYASYNNTATATGYQGYDANAAYYQGYESYYAAQPAPPGMNPPGVGNGAPGLPQPPPPATNPGYSQPPPPPAPAGTQGWNDVRPPGQH